MTHEFDRVIADTDLAAALAVNLDGCFERLVLQFQDRLYAFALRLSDSPQDAEEIAQDAFVRAYRALSGYPAERVAALALKPWLYQITINVFRNFVRGRHLRSVPLDAVLDAGYAEPSDDEQARPESQVVRAERERELGARLASLPERYRIAVTLRHIEGFGYHELAELLHQPVGTVKANVHRGTRLLRSALEQSMEEVS